MFRVLYAHHNKYIVK